jgi:hypothetical protein
MKAAWRQQRSSLHSSSARGVILSGGKHHVGSCMALIINRKPAKIMARNASRRCWHQAGIASAIIFITSRKASAAIIGVSRNFGAVAAAWQQAK